MYTYKCYFHPKDDSAGSCSGCKLPICGPCHGVEGACRECVEKRRSVQQLRNLRHVAASKTHVGSTTARLRLAIAQVGPESSRRGAQPLQPTAGMHTRPLDASLAAGLTRRLPPEPQARRYNPEAVAYKPVTSRAPATRHQNVKRVAAKAPAASAPHWAMPFIAGLGAGAVLVAAFMLSQSLLGQAPAKAPQQGALPSQLVSQDVAIAEPAPVIGLRGGQREDTAPAVGFSGP